MGWLMGVIGFIDGGFKKECGCNEDWLQAVRYRMLFFKKLYQGNLGLIEQVLETKED